MKKLLFIILLPIILYSQQYSLSFDGGDYLLHNIATYRSTDNRGAVAFIVRISSAGSIERIFCSSDNAGTVQWIMLRKENANNRFQWIDKNGVPSENVQATTTTASANTWYWVVIESNGSKHKITINNISQTLTGTDTGNWFNDIPLRDNISVGHLVYGSGPLAGFTGNIAELYVFSDTLTAAQHIMFYNSGKIYNDHTELTSISVLADAWLFNEGSGTTTTNTAGDKAFQFGDGLTPTTYPTWSSDTPEISVTPTGKSKKNYNIYGKYKTWLK